MTDGLRSMKAPFFWCRVVYTSGRLQDQAEATLQTSPQIAPFLSFFILMPLFPLPLIPGALPPFFVLPLSLSICLSFYPLKKCLFLVMCSLPNHCGEHQDVKSNRAPWLEMTPWGKVMIGLWWHLIRGHINTHLRAVPATRSCKIPKENVCKENGVMKNKESLSIRTRKLGWTVWKIPACLTGKA